MDNNDGYARELTIKFMMIECEGLSKEQVILDAMDFLDPVNTGNDYLWPVKVTSVKNAPADWE